MDGYRLRSAHGDTVDPRQPLPVGTLKAKETKSQSSTLTYNGKAAAGSITVNALPMNPIISIEGDQVASYWGDIQNKVYEAYADGQDKKERAWLTSVTETNGAAAITIYDPDKNLEEMFESATGTVKRFIVKVIDNTGYALYGWVRGVAAASGVYTFEVFNNRSSESAQNWVGTLASFDNASLVKVEIYHYNSSLVFGTGTILTEEVECPKEYSKNWENPIVYAETLSNGQYFVDYMRGRIIGVKAATTASETVTYNVWTEVESGSGLTAPVTFTKSVTTAGTAVPLSATSKVVKKVSFQPDTDNTGDNIYHGDSNVDSSNGLVLVPYSIYEYENVDLKDIYIDADSNGDGVHGYYEL